MICWFDKAQYLLGQDIRIHVPGQTHCSAVTVYRLEKPVGCDWRMEEDTLVISHVPAGSFGVTVQAGSSLWEGAFDVVADPRQVTRYGFLSDFSSDDGETADIAWMRDLHINAVQFYDWMYRHDALLPPDTKFSDPMGRDMDLDVIRGKVSLCKAWGIRPIAYGAIYAATRETFEQHPQWGMYTMDGQPMTFANWLYYMNVSPDCGWTDHILKEYRKAMAFGFSGIHMDTYGFPKRVWDSDGHPVELSSAFAKLIDRAAEIARLEDAYGGVIFNAVNNWPMEAVATTRQDAVYIEVWPPNDTYHDLYTLIREARLCSGKQVVLAAYLKPFQGEDVSGAERAFRFSWAAISASGGTQLVLGEQWGALQDSYYARYAKLRPDFLPVVQKYCDFLVRYADLMYNDDGTDTSKTASGGINEDICFESENCRFSADGKADTVWTIIRETGCRLTIHLVNLKGNDERWNVAKREPEPAEKIRIHLRLDRPVDGFYCASADRDSLGAEKLPYAFRNTDQGRIYSVDVPAVQYWTAIWASLEE